jgi:voltage-gated potassium channel
VIREELDSIWAWQERHRRLVARIIVAGTLTLFVDLVCSVLMWRFERHADGTAIHTMGDAMFFTTVQLLTVSSQMPNPVTTAGRFVDVVLEIWALFVVTAVAGSFAAFFSSRD